jgi:Protein of unknown function (DUF1559)
MRNNLMAWSLMAVAGFLLVWSSRPATSSVVASETQSEASPTSLLPKTTVAAFIVDGTDKHQPAIADTAAWKSLEETGLRDRVFDLLQTAVTLAVPEAGRDARELLEHVMSNGASAAISLSASGNELTPYSVLVLHGAADYAEPVAALLNSSIGRQRSIGRQQKDGRAISTVNLGPEGVDFSWWTESDHLVFAVGVNAVEQVLATASGDVDNITDNATYTALRSRQEFTVDSLGWLDAAAVIDQFGNMPFPEPPSGKRLSIRDFLKLLGVENLKGVAVQSGYEGAACWSHCSIDVDGKLTGLLALLKQRDLTLDDLPRMPADTTGFFASSFDSSQAYADVMKVVKRFADLAGDRARDDVAEFEATASEFLGGDPRSALLDAVGDVWCVYSDPTGMPIPIGFSPVVCFAVEDRDKLLNAIEGFLPLLQRELRAERLTIRKSWKDGNLYFSFAIAGAPIVPTIIVTEDWVVASLVPGSAQTFVLRQQGELDAWTPDERVAEALEQLPEQFTSISVSDPAPAYTQMLSFAPMAMTLFETQVAPNLPGGDRVQLPFGIEDLPIAQRVVAPMFPNVAVSTSGEGGVESWSRHSVPSNPMGTVGASATIPVLIALLLPAVQQAREAARRTQSRNNLKQMAIAMHNYHDTYNGFPRGTVENEDLAVDERLSWTYSLLAYMDQTPMFNAVDKNSGWESNANAQFSATAIPILQNPSMPRGDARPGSMDYVGIAGVGPDAASLPKDDPKAGIFGYDRITKIRDIRDGTSNTIMIGDASQPNLSWMAGGKSTIRGFSQSPYLNGPDGIGSHHPGIVQFAFADGSVRAISVEIDETLLEALATKSGGEVVGEF